MLHTNHVDIWSTDQIKNYINQDFKIPHPVSCLVVPRVRALSSQKKKMEPVSLMLVPEFQS